MSTIGQLLRLSLARTLRRTAALLDRLALSLQSPAAPVSAAAADSTPAEGPPAHWLQHARRPPPAHWLAYIRRQAPHLLVGDGLNDAAWLTQAAPSTLTPLAPAVSVTAEEPAPVQARPAAAEPAAAAASPAPTTAAAQSTPRLRPTRALPRHPLRLRPVETAASAPRPGLAENALPAPAAPTLDVSAPAASMRPAAQPRPERPAPPLPRRPMRPVESAAPAPTLSAFAPDDAPSTAPPAIAASASRPPHEALSRAHANRLPLSPVGQPAAPQPPSLRAPTPAAPPPPAAAPKPARPAAAAQSPTPAPPPPRPRPQPTAAPSAPQRPAPIAADPWPQLPPAADPTPSSSTGASPSTPAWPTLPPWPAAAELETPPDLRAWQRRQRLQREQRGLLWNE